MKHLTEGKINEMIVVTVKRGIIGKQLLNDLMERENTGNWKRNHKIAICGKVALEKAMVLSIDRPQN